MSCDRLYLRDSNVRRFRARVLDWSADGPAGAAALDRTAFYPGGGGQPADRGLIAGRPVAEAVEREGSPDQGPVWHRFGPEAAGLPPLSPGEEVDCELDWDRRFDLMQQHTGQHLISAVALAAFEGQTTGFHLTDETATVDLAFGTQPAAGGPEPVGELLARLERVACAEVFADRPVRLHLVPPGEVPCGAAPGLELRVREHGPAPKGGNSWRVVEIEGLDLSPCGGTHVASTGQVGLITFQRWERIRDSVRVEFACGRRALQAAVWRNSALKRLARELSVHERDAADRALCLLADAAARDKEREREISRLRRELLAGEAAALCADGEEVGGNRARIVARILPGHTPDQLKQLAAQIASRPRAVALLASGGAASAETRAPRLVFARADDVELDVRAPLAAAAEALGGRGGGRPHLAQGGGGNPAALEAALAAAVECARSLLGCPAEPQEK